MVDVSENELNPTFIYFPLFIQSSMSCPVILSYGSAMYRYFFIHIALYVKYSVTQTGEKCIEKEGCTYYCIIIMLLSPLKSS